jgi:Kef-type K+ transport system membrane component KefB
MHEASVGVTLMYIAVILLAAKLSSLVERFGQPAVLGEMLIGVVLGNLVLAGMPFFEPIKHSGVIKFLAEFGVVILLFQVGLESNVQDMQKVGRAAFLVACVGVVLPMVLVTYVVGPLLLPDLSLNAHLFLGATLTATSVGITARVFRDLGALQTREAQIVLGAAVIDDVLGLIILAVVSAIVTVGTVNATDVLRIVGTALAFLVGAVVIGQVFARQLGRLFARVNTGQGMKLTMALAVCLICAYLAELVGLAPIVGAFAAGLVLDAVHFHPFESPRFVQAIQTATAHIEPQAKAALDDVLDHYTDRHIEDLVEPVGTVMAPIFFVLTGMSVSLTSLFNLQILLTALGITLVAFVSKIAAGLIAGDVNKWVVGWGMVPRGEVGLIFAAAGLSLGVINQQIFSMIVIVIMFTTLLTPPILTLVVRRNERRGVARLTDVPWSSSPSDRGSAPVIE